MTYQTDVHLIHILNLYDAYSNAVMPITLCVAAHCQVSCMKGYYTHLLLETLPKKS